MQKPETSLFVLRRKDTGEYFKLPSKGMYVGGWKPDDPRRRHWTKDLELATLYPRRSIKSLRGNVAGDTGLSHGIEGVKLSDLEIVRVKVVVDCVVKL